MAGGARGVAACAVGAALALAALLGGAAPAMIEMPIGLPGSGILLALDGLSSLFLLLLFVAGAAAPAPRWTDDGRKRRPLVPMLIGAMAATTLAADGFSVVLAFEATALATAASCWRGGARPRAGRGYSAAVSRPGLR